MAKWLDKYEQGGQVLKKKTKDNYGKKPNVNDVKVSAGPGFEGDGYTAQNWKSPAWGGQFEMGGALPGSVGFMYARTQNPAPANGKYAKKTKASAQDGKALDPTADDRSTLGFNTTDPAFANVRTNSFVPFDRKDFEGIKQNIAGYMNSPLYMERLGKSYSDPEVAKDVQKQRLDNLLSIKLNPKTTDKGTYYNAITNRVNLGASDFIDNPMVTHEIAHGIIPNLTTSYGKQNIFSKAGLAIADLFQPFEQFNKSELEKINRPLSGRITAPNLDYMMAREEEHYKPQESKASAKTAANETYGDLTGIRQLLLDNGVTTEFGQELTPEMFQKALKNPKVSNEPTFQRMKLKFSDEDIIKMNNEVAYNNRMTPLDQAKSGVVIKDDMGQWAHPGEITEINSNDITMEGVDYPVLGISDTGDTKMMYPDQDYKFDGDKVTEFPMMEKGGWLNKYKAQDGKKVKGKYKKNTDPTGEDTERARMLGVPGYDPWEITNADDPKAEFFPEGYDSPKGTLPEVVVNATRHLTPSEKKRRQIDEMSKYLRSNDNVLSSDQMASQFKKKLEVDKQLAEQKRLAKRETVRSYDPELEDQSTLSKAWNIAAHPMTALSYKTRGRDIPEHFERLDNTNPLDYAVDAINPFFYANQAGDATKDIGGFGYDLLTDPYHANPDKLGSGLLHAASALPLFSDFAPAISRALENPITRNLKDLQYAKSVYEPLGYKIPENLERIAQSKTLTDRTIRGLVNRDNSFFRGVTTDWDLLKGRMNLEYGNVEGPKRWDQFVNTLKDKGIDIYTNPKEAAEYMATHVPLSNAGFGRSGVSDDILDAGYDALYTSNSSNLGEGYTYGQGYLVKGKRPTFFDSKNRKDWIDFNQVEATRPKKWVIQSNDIKKPVQTFKTDYSDQHLITEYDPHEKAQIIKGEGMLKLAEEFPDYEVPGSADQKKFRETVELLNDIGWENKEKYHNALNDKRNVYRGKKLDIDAKYNDFFNLTKNQARLKFFTSPTMWKDAMLSAYYENQMKRVGRLMNTPKEIELLSQPWVERYPELKNYEFPKPNRPYLPFGHYLHVGPPGTKILDPVFTKKITPEIWNNQSRSHINQISEKVSRKENGGWLDKYDKKAQSGKALSSKNTDQSIINSVIDRMMNAPLYNINKNDNIPTQPVFVKEYKNKQEYNKQQANREQEERKRLAQSFAKSYVQPTISQDRSTPASREADRQMLIDAHVAEAQRNSPFAQTLGSFTPGGYNPEAGAIAARQFAESTPIMSGVRISRAVRDPKNNPYGIGEGKGYASNILGTAGLLGDVFDFGSIVTAPALRGASNVASDIERAANTSGVNILNNAGSKAIVNDVKTALRNETGKITTKKSSKVTPIKQITSEAASSNAPALQVAASSTGGQNAGLPSIQKGWPFKQIDMFGEFLFNEALGEFVKGNRNRRAIKKGNEWFAEWIKDPVTQQKLYDDMLSGYQKSQSAVGMYQHPSVYQTYLKYLQDYVPHASEYPLSNQWKELKENMNPFGNPTYENTIHGNNAGVSYRHGFNPYVELGLIDPPNIPTIRQEGPGTWISRRPLMLQSERASTTVHEIAHDWLKSDLINDPNLPYQKMIKDALRPDMIKAYDDWIQSGGKGYGYGYFADPTEVVSRAMELRKHFKLTPGTKVTAEMAEEMLKKVSEGKTPIKWKFGEIFKDSKSAANLLNKLPALAPVAVGAGVLGGGESKEQKNGGWLNKYK